MTELMPTPDPELEAAIWDLGPIVDHQGDDGARQLLLQAQDRAERFAAAHAGRVAAFDADALVTALAELDEISGLQQRAEGYAYLRGATEANDPASAAVQAAVDAGRARTHTTLLFFELEWLALDDGQVEALLSAAGERLDFAAHFLQRLRARGRYRLSPAEERILAETSVQRLTAWKRMYAENSSGLTVELDGETQPLALAYTRLSSPHRSVRQAAEAASVDGCQPGLSTRVAAYNQMLGERAVDDRLRGYPTWLSARNLANETTDAAVDAMRDAITARRDIPHRWNRLKAQLLGIERLGTCDLWAPLPGVPRSVSYGQARAIVTSAWSDFSPRAGAIVEAFFSEGRIDAPIRPGKSGGARCGSAGPHRPAYVLINYASQPQETMDLAHELGHGLHFELARACSALHYETSIPMMEVASTFSEALITGRLTAEASDDRARLELLTARLDGATTGVFTCIAQLDAEAAMHGARRDRGELSAAELTELWTAAHQEMWQDTVDIGLGYGLIWSYIPHLMEEPGYLYSYAFGELTAWSAFARYEEVGPAFAEDYLAMLAAGGSHSPADLVAMLGLDIDDPGFWNAGLDRLDATLSEAEALAAAL